VFVEVTREVSFIDYVDELVVFDDWYLFDLLVVYDIDDVVDIGYGVYLCDFVLGELIGCVC